MSAFKEEELIMTKRKDESEQFKPLSAVATSITSMGINEDGEFYEKTNPIDNEAESKERLTNQQLAQQDAVDAAIYVLLLELAGGEEREDDLWEIVGVVRETISEEFHERGIMAQKDFYPWVGCECEDHDPRRAGPSGVKRDQVQQ